MYILLTFNQPVLLDVI